jgi:hypothetical protein
MILLEISMLATKGALGGECIHEPLNRDNGAVWL